MQLKNSCSKAQVHCPLWQADIFNARLDENISYFGSFNCHHRRAEWNKKWLYHSGWRWGRSQLYPCLKPAVRFIYSEGMFIEIELPQREKAGVFWRLLLNQLLRLGFRTLGKALLKPTGTVSSLWFFSFFFFLIPRSSHNSTKKAGLGEKKKKKG